MWGNYKLILEGSIKIFKAIPTPPLQTLLNFLGRKGECVVGTLFLKEKLHLFRLQTLHVTNIQPFHNLLIVLEIDICNEDFNLALLL